MTPTAEVVSILKNNKLTGVDVKNIHAFSIPSDDWDLTPILQINEVTNYPSMFGNNDNNYNKISVQVQVYYSPDYSGNMGATEESIKAAMKANGYRVSDNGVHIPTPDKNILITIKFNKLKEI